MNKIRKDFSFIFCKISFEYFNARFIPNTLFNKLLPEDFAIINYIIY